ncbi:DNA-binding MarR family transcriptional regulator [Amycolatopsis bartoniae]|uniref:MarR family transcriptional regulator n=1 Tax=Amycolatopsis bartoniae TaxID=941986 RepID=A0A8H9IXL9_9PSEU|nr:MarR family transcriptional regulator [Amycolatopsis bartoniae]MBB2935805.1 DNA-binding MarR family transcriptional regulator [Amycolatopsis bartoniae]TVT00276.1 MarR family transcriptional regulator [Amycolatopsis bartoniae]GHF61974.1 MarR family transcriptional regulator [Amycolatopsis bartoniae]
MTRVPNEVARLAGALRGVLGQLHRRLRHVGNAGVLTPSQSAVLSRLHRDGPATQTQLAAAEHVRQQSMAATLGVLDELGYLRRTPDPHDGRRTVISLSDLGTRTVRGVHQHREEWLATALAGFTREERETIDRALPLLERLAQS